MKRILFVGAVDPVSFNQNIYNPLWPAYLAAHIEKKLGSKNFEFRFITDRVEDEITSFKPDVVAISSITQNYNYAIEYARITKRYNLPVIIGGIHITSIPNCLTSDMDVGCIGEGEETFVELMRYYLASGCFKPDGLNKINGIVYHDNGKLVKNPKRNAFTSLDQIPHPKRSIIGYQQRSYVYTARGCAYNCDFCVCNYFWGNVRYASAEYVIEEIRELIENNVKIIRFADENFTIHKERLENIAKLIVENDFHKQAKFSCWTRADSITQDVIQTLRSINMVSLKMGFESGSQRTLNYLKEDITVEDNWRAIELCKEAGFQVNGDFLIGAPHETKEDIIQTYEFIKKSRLDFVDINLFTPYPGTAVWEYAVQKHLVSDDMDWSRINIKFNETRDSAVILSERLSYRELYRAYKKLKRLSLYKTLKALPHSPWRQEIPKVLYGCFVEKIFKTCSWCFQSKK